MKLKTLKLTLISVLTLSSISRADFVCTTSDQEGLVVKAFQLGIDESFHLITNKAAVILKQDGANSLLTGTVKVFPTRTGSNHSFNLVDEKSNQATLSVAVIYFRKTQVHATLNYADKSYALQCTESTL